ncbi:MAG: DUF3800 domain-containing protein [Boseongicola sp.]|nr:MAG: DUF3800 domain-containing protein [Boseongicola sp.]
MGGLLTRSNHEADVVDWVRDIRNTIDARQGAALHYRNLSPSKKDSACRALSNLPVRAFAVCSHKLNMKGHNNNRAAKRGGKQWFYNYCVRILMERATTLCANDCLRNHSEFR